jgi:hypothetical protein
MLTAYLLEAVCTDTYVSSGGACFKGSCSKLATTLKPLSAVKAGAMKSAAMFWKVTPSGGSKEP